MHKALLVNLEHQRNVYTFIKKIIKDYIKYPFHSLLYNFERNINFTLNTITIENTPQKMIKSSSNFSIFNNEFSTKIVKEKMKFSKKNCFKGIQI